MKRILSLPVFLLAGGAFAQEGEPATPPVPPTFAEVAYGPHERNVLDVWKADAETPTPVVFFIHGGAWNTSDKSRVASAIEMDELLAAGISIVAINYRYLTQAQAEGIDPPVKGPLTDAACALQFVRWKAPEWGFDKLRVAAVGGSAGGCSSLWLALHDDMADPGSADPVARESTRLFCAAVLVPQTSLDPAEMREWIPNINYGAHAFGLRTPGKSLDESFQDFYEARERLLPQIREYSPSSHASADDPPLWIYYGCKMIPTKGQPQDETAHSELFGQLLQEKLLPLGVDVILTSPAKPAGGYRNMAAFLISKLKR